jgi:hypothetical protein
MMTDSPLDTQEIVRLYIEEALSVREIATRFERSYGRIYGILRTRIVMRTSNGPGRRRDGAYIEVAELMREHIISGHWPPRRKILPQRDLAQIFDVKPQVIREAIAHLRQHGYLQTVRSKGTYVRPPRDWEYETR